MTTDTRLIQVGNSRGVRIPKPLIEEAGLQDEVRLSVVESGIMIEGVSSPRAGWDKAAKEIRERGEDGLVDEPVLSDFDELEWVWE